VLYSHIDPDHTMGMRVFEQMRLNWNENMWESDLHMMGWRWQNETDGRYDPDGSNIP